MNWHAYASAEQCVEALVATTSEALQNAIKARGAAYLAVSGGRSPIAFFNSLSRADIDWPRVHISLVDERFVDPAHEDSNEHLVRTHLLINRARHSIFTGLVSHTADINHCVKEANQRTGKITLAILGMGDDGHTASLFPNAPELTAALDSLQTQRYMRITPPAAPYERITMTLAALLQTQRIVLDIAGLQKKQIFEQAVSRATPALPISYFIAQDAVPFDVYWHA